MAVATPTYERSAGRSRLAKQKKALPDGSFPIPNVAYLGKAIKAVGRAAPGKRPALAALIRKRAKQLGAAGAAKLKGSWADPKKNTKEMAQAPERTIVLRLVASGRVGVSHWQLVRSENQPTGSR